MKSVCIPSFSGQYFPEFELNLKRYSVCSPHTGKYRSEKIRIRILFTQCIAHHYLLTLHTKKTTDLPNAPLNACEIKLEAVKEKGSPPSPYPLRGK